MKDLITIFILIHLTTGLIAYFFYSIHFRREVLKCILKSKEDCFKLYEVLSEAYNIKEENNKIKFELLTNEKIKILKKSFIDIVFTTWYIIPVLVFLFFLV